MLTNYLKLAFRNLAKRPQYSLLNLAGLATGMVCCLLIMQYVLYEWSYDRFPERADDIYRLHIDCYQKEQLSWRSATVFPAYGPTIQRDFPEVEATCRIYDADGVFTNHETEVKFSEKKGYFADPAFLNVFSLPLVQGNAQQALDGPSKMVVSEKFARKYFGTDNVVGKIINRNGNDTNRNLEITGVFKEFPGNSHLIVDYLVSMNTLANISQERGDTTRPLETSWGWYDFYTYVKLRPGTDGAAFAAKMPAFTNKYVNDEDSQKAGVSIETFVDPLTNIHLYSDLNQEAEPNGNGKAVGLLLGIALFIIGLAWVNYINLATARAVERAREVGVRKVSGATRGQLVAQFLTESLLLNGTALLIAIIAVSALSPVFGNFLGKDLTVGVFTGIPLMWMTIVFLSGALLSGFYPSVVLSGFHVSGILKGAFKTSSAGINLRRGLIVGQFTVSVAMLVGVMVVNRQVSFMRGQNPGFNRAQTLVMEGAETLPDSAYTGVYQSFKNEVMQIPGVQGISGSSSVPGDEIYWTSGFTVLNAVNQERQTLYILGADADFMPLYNLQLVAGRAFESTDKNTTILNETAVKRLGFASPEAVVGQFILRGRRDTMQVRGVVRDFNHLGLQKSVDPVCMRFANDMRNYYSVRIAAGSDFQSVIGKTETVWKKHFTADPYHYFFLDEFFDRQYRSDVQFGQVFSWFTALAIFIACLGLFGLASYIVVQRTKEIGIRKVLGASVLGITGLLAKDFLKLVLAAIVISIPIAWYYMHHWLNSFAYRIDLQWWMFAVAGLSALAIAAITVSFQSVRAALSNPVKSLRSE